MLDAVRAGQGTQSRGRAAPLNVVRAIDPEHRPNTRDENVLQIVAESRRQRIGEPVEATIGVTPLSSRRREQLTIAARLFESRRVRCELQQRNGSKLRGIVGGWRVADRRQMRRGEIPDSDSILIERKAKRDR